MAGSKEIAIIAVDTLPLPLKEGYPEELWVEDQNGQGKLASYKNQFSRSTGLGNRVWNIAKQLAAAGLSVTILAPKHRLPPSPDFIDIDKLPFKIEAYNLTKVTFQYSDDFYQMLSRFDIVIVQPGGTALWNCIYLPKKIKVILDGYIPILAEQPNWLTEASSNCSTYTRDFVYDRFLDIHIKLMKRVDAIIYANENQARYYEGQLLLLGRIDLDESKLAVPLIKLPMSVDPIKTPPFHLERALKDPLRVLWYGGAYPWFDPSFVIDMFKDSVEVSVDFCGLKHPRFMSSDENADRTSLEIVKYSNMKILDTDFVEDSQALFSKYHVGIVIAKETPEQKYAHRSRILEMVSHGLPVITDTPCDFADEFGLKSIRSLCHSDLKKVAKYFPNLHSLYDPLDIEIINNTLTWSTTTKPLIDYMSGL